MNSLMTLVDAATNTFAVNFQGRVYSCILPCNTPNIVDVEWKEEVLEVYTGWVEVRPTRVTDPITNKVIV